VIGGWQQTTTDNITKFMVIRLTSAGAMDPSFGVGGIGTSGNLVSLDSTYGEVAMSLQSDGKVVLVSTTQDNKFAAARFDGNPALLAASLPTHINTATITADQVQPLLTEVLARWQAPGAGISALHGIHVRIADLGGTTLGLTIGHTIWLDDNAAGWGWFVDPTPADDSEFTTPGDQGEQRHMELLTVLEHELGHLLGREHSADGVMAGTLQGKTGMIRWPSRID
jgi:hypothetical protein